MTFEQVMRGLRPAGWPIRDEVIEGFTSRGGSKARWGRKDLHAMATAITAVEDRLDNERQTDRLRKLKLALKKIRRQLEDSVDL